MIILEGPDGGGKSTLAQALHVITGWPVITGEGPPKTPEEFVERLAKYRALPRRVICDRHPVICDPIYARVFQRRSLVTELDAAKLKYREKYVLFCVPTSDDIGEQNNSHSDTPEFVAHLKANIRPLRTFYEAYFRDHRPHGRYRIGDGVPTSLLGYITDVT